MSETEIKQKEGTKDYDSSIIEGINCLRECLVWSVSYTNDAGNEVVEPIIDNSKSRKRIENKILELMDRL